MEKVARYLNGLRQGIQDEVTMMTPDSMHKCFQMALRKKYKVRRRTESYQRGRGNNIGFRGRGNFGRGQSLRNGDEFQPTDNSGGNQSKGYF